MNLDANGLPRVHMGKGFYGRNPLSLTPRLKMLTDQRIRHYERAGFYSERRTILQRREGKLVWSA
jgi:hypothetical protein